MFPEPAIGREGEAKHAPVAPRPDLRGNATLTRKRVSRSRSTFRSQPDDFAQIRIKCLRGLKFEPVTAADGSAVAVTDEPKAPPRVFTTLPLPTAVFTSYKYVGELLVGGITYVIPKLTGSNHSLAASTGNGRVSTR